MEIDWALAARSLVRVGFLAFVLTLLYGGLKRLTLWRWSGTTTVDANRNALERYEQTLESRYRCSTCEVEREGREFYFNPNGPDGHLLKKCKVCVDRDASST